MARRRFATAVLSLFALTAAFGMAGCQGDDGGPAPAQPAAPDDSSSDDAAKPAAPMSTAQDAFSRLAPADLALLDAQETLTPVLDSVEVEASKDPSFAHAVMDVEAGQVIVYRVGGADAAVQRRLQAVAGPNTTVVLRPSLLSEVEAQTWAARLDDDAPALAAAGVVVTKWGPDEDGGTFGIGAKGDVASAKKVLEAKYPELAGRFQVEQSSIGPAFGRRADAAPFWGGDYLDLEFSRTGQLPGACTGGFGAKNAYGTFMITAAHCNCPNRDATVLTYPLHRMGTWSSVVDRGLDAAYISAPTGADIYTNSLYGHYPAYSAVTSAGHPRRGEHLCASGSFSGLRCGGIVRGWKHIGFDTCDGWRVVGEWVLEQPTHAALAGEGDSGGPVFAFQPSSRSASARGLTSAIDFGQLVTCAEGGTDRACSWRMYFPDIVPIMQRHGFRLTGF